ncbi:MAG: complex I NDUFA9 subunit family protein [Rhodospirillaceae bacterium]|nr:complex I NDUFA9 subunit family protein [Rhodospirillaceae bacterium]
MPADPNLRVVTVFGGTGFIGRHVTGRLARRGWRVRIATRSPRDALFLKPNGAVGQIAPIYTDLGDDGSVAAALRGAHYAIFLPGVLYERGSSTFQAVHVEAAGRVARLAAEAGCQRLVHMSALGVGKDSESAYARTKAAGEEAVRAAYPAASILRPSVVFGPEDNFFNQFAEMARISPALPLIGGGKTRFQPVYVGDVADAVMACLDRGDAPGRTYELGGPQVYTFKELLKIVLHETRRHRALVSVPWGMANLQARVLQLLPKPPLTRDQVTLLKSDNVLSGGQPGLAELGITPTAAEVILPTYLWRYRPGGRFADREAEA